MVVKSFICFSNTNFSVTKIYAFGLSVSNLCNNQKHHKKLPCLMFESFMFSNSILLAQQKKLTMKLIKLTVRSNNVVSKNLILYEIGA